MSKSLAKKINNSELSNEIGHLNDIVLPSKYHKSKSLKPVVNTFEREKSDFIHEMLKEFSYSSPSHDCTLHYPAVLDDVMNGQEYDKYGASNKFQRLIAVLFDKAIQRVENVAFGSVYDYLLTYFLRNHMSFEPSDAVLKSLDLPVQVSHNLFSKLVATLHFIMEYPGYHFPRLELSYKLPSGDFKPFFYETSREEYFNDLTSQISDLSTKLSSLEADYQALLDANYEYLSEIDYLETSLKTSSETSKTELSSVQASLVDANSKISDLNSKISDLNTANKDLHDVIASLETELNEFKKRDKSLINRVLSHKRA